jgi:hypothetical protein
VHHHLSLSDGKRDEEKEINARTRKALNRGCNPRKLLMEQQRGIQIDRNMMNRK